MLDVAPIDSKSMAKFKSEGRLNVSLDALFDNVKTNIRRGLPQIHPHEVNHETALLVCSGASLADTENELVEAYWNGGKIMAVNGAYKWCLEHNLKPSAVSILDARPHNARFLERAAPRCKYMLASQCHPMLFDMCKDRETYIWHACSGGDEEYDLLKEYYFKRVFPVEGGTTVGIRTIFMLRMLGFTKIEIFGLDSCWLGDRHHAFEQPENDDKRHMVWLSPDGRDDKAEKFWCANWHMKQAQDFQELIKKRGDMFELRVHGDGLIAAILRIGAEIQMETKNGS